MDEDLHRENRLLSTMEWVGKEDTTQQIYEQGMIAEAMERGRLNKGS